MFRNASRVALAVLGSAALAATAALPASADGHHRHTPQHSRYAVALGPVQYESPGRDDRSNRSLNAEWVTVRNNGRMPVSLRGWTLSDRSGHTYRFGNVRLAGHSQVRVHTGRGYDNRWDVYQNRRDYVWDSRDTATLRNDHHRVVDQVRWGHGNRH
ncbi:lamin tail domain-containing protein [Streptomyces sp. NPDC048612]|uniref:lamin tail domain-containing protein n=1 Tax=Streptomyces sp. NPDC048612 TaxID=3365579 RepID=UPI00371601C0